MRIYLTGKRGSTAPFKITTAQVRTNIDYLIEIYFEAYLKEKDHYKNFYDYASTYYGRSRTNIYVGDTEIDAPVKKINEKMWNEILRDYGERHPDKYAKFCLSE